VAITADIWLVKSLYRFWPLSNKPQICRILSYGPINT
jgi:hypothetical protein